MSGPRPVPLEETEVRVDERRLRLAMFSPVPPTASGISSYLLDLLPLLPEAWELDVFTDEQIHPDALFSSGSGKPVECFAHPDFEERNTATPYDLVIYQVGNSTARAWMFDYVLAYPGLLVLHDGIVHPARVDAATAAAAIPAYRSMVDRCRGAVGRVVGHLVAGGLGGPALYFTFPMCEDLVRASRLTAMHGQLSCDWLRGLVPNCRVAPLAHWRSVDVGEELVESWRGRLGGADDVVIGCFGNIGADRRLDRVIAALADIDPARPWRFAVVGTVDERLGLADQAEELGIADRIAWHQGLSDADFTAAMAAVDVAVNLRYPQARASSGVLHQLLLLGVPTLISDVVHWREYPDEAVARIPPGPDEAEGKALRAALANWIVNPVGRAAAARAASAWAATHISPARMRGSYVDAVGAALRSPGGSGPTAVAGPGAGS